MAKKGNAGRVAAEIGAGLAAAGAAAAAGYYFYGSTKAKQHRKIAAKWAGKLKNEVVRDARRLEAATPGAIAKIVDTAARAYKEARSVDSAELKRAVSELKANWETVSKEARGSARKGVAKARSTAKKMVAKAKSRVKSQKKRS